MSNIIPFPGSESSGPPDLRAGRRVHCILYGGKDGIITAVHGTPAPASVRRLMGGGIVAGGRATLDVAFPEADFPHLSSVPEAILYGPQWQLMPGIASEGEIAGALAIIAEARKNAKERREHEVREMEEARRRGEAFLTPRRPAWATHVIVGELQQDDSDSMTDYYASHTTRTLLLAWSKHGRCLFPEMRKAAALDPETAHLGPGCNEYRIRLCYDHDSTDQEGQARLRCRWADHYREGESVVAHFWNGDIPPFTECPMGWRVPYFTRREEAESYFSRLPARGGCRWEITEESIEQRENWSMGHGMYLGRRRHSGWHVRKIGLRWEELCIVVGKGGYRIPEKDTPKKATRFQPVIETPKPTPLSRAAQTLASL